MADKILNSVTWPDMPEDRYYIPYDQINSMILKAFPTKSLASSPIHAFSDGADGIPIKAMEVAVRAVQDLHGYDHPWLAGGGKNKLSSMLADVKTANTGGTWTGDSYALNGVTFTFDVASDGCITAIHAKGTATANTALRIGGGSTLVDDTEYVITGCPADGSGTTYQLGVVRANGTNWDNGSGYTFTPTSTNAFLRADVMIRNGYAISGTLTFYPMVRLSSVADATFAPYSNICPIIGWTEANIVDNGINQWDEVWEQGNINNNGENAPSSTIIRSKNYIRISPSTEYYICGSGIKPYYYDEYKNFLNTAASKTNQTTTTPAGAHYMRFVQTGTTYNHDISINYPSTDTSYHAYNGYFVIIEFNGIVYGGTLRYVGGLEWEFTATHAAVDLGSALTSVTRQANSDDNQTVSNFLCLFSYTGDAKYEGGFVHFVSNRFSLDTANFSASSGEGILWGMNQGRIYLRINRSRLSEDTPTGLTAWLTANQTNLVYELEQPVTVTLTADSDTVTVYGDNVMYADCGDSELTYRQDIGLVIGELSEELSNAIVSLGENV